MDLAFFGAAIGAAVAVIGAGYGISYLARSALEGMARQPEASADLRGAMIIAAALIEGIAFFALIICLLTVLLLPKG
jgi:F-type H+-transporting ATPase subunit c